MLSVLGVQSVGLPWPLFASISGLTYSGVPQVVRVRSFSPTFFAKPKSQILT